MTKQPDDDFNSDPFRKQRKAPRDPSLRGEPGIVDKGKQNRNLLLAIGGVIFAGVVWGQQTAKYNPPTPALVQTSTGPTTDNAVITPGAAPVTPPIDPTPASTTPVDTFTDTAPPDTSADTSGTANMSDGSVTYTVDSSCPVNLTYSGDGGGTEQESGVPGGWTKDVFPGNFAYISAQLTCEGGDVSVDISQGGLSLKDASSSGDYVIANASASLP